MGARGTRQHRAAAPELGGGVSSRSGTACRAFSQGGAREHDHEHAHRDEESQGGGEAAGYLRERADRGWPGEGAEIADRGDGGDRDCWGGTGGARGGAEHGRGQRGEAEAEQRPAGQGRRGGGRGDREQGAGGGGGAAALHDADAPEARDEPVAEQPPDGQGEREQREGTRRDGGGGVALAAHVHGAPGVGGAV